MTCWIASATHIKPPPSAEFRTEHYCRESNDELDAENIYGYLRSLLYHRRNKMNPLWNSLIVAGVNDKKER